MEKAKLVLPEKKYLQSYLEACQEYKDHEVAQYRFHDPDTYEDWKDSIFTAYEEARHGINLKSGYVPSTTFWLVEDDTFIGTGNIRHYLSDFLEAFGGHIGYAVRWSKWGQGYGAWLLRLLLQEAHKLGISKALVTCDEGNYASVRVLEKNDAIYQDTIENIIDGVQHITKRYWIYTGGQK